MKPSTITQGISALNFAFLRTPILPWVRELSPKYLWEQFKDPCVKEAIYIATPSLFQALESQAALSEVMDKKGYRLQLSLYKYLLRMSSKCVPFGGFAGVSNLTMGNASKVLLHSKEDSKRVVRFDMEFLCLVAEEVMAADSLAAEIHYYPNPTIFTTDLYINISEYKITNRSRFYTQTAIERDEYLDKILVSARSGAKLDDLITLLVDPEISLSDAHTYIKELINSQILISDFQPSLLGQDYFERLYAIVCNSSVSDADLKQRFALMKASLIELNKAKFSEGIDAMKRHTAILKAEFPTVEAEHVFQSDLYRNTKASILSNAITKELEKSIEFLAGIPTTTSIQRLGLFKDAFVKRYDQQEVDLLEVLDPQIGLGYAKSKTDLDDQNPLLQDLPFLGPATISRTVEVNAWQEFILKSLMEVERSGKRVLQLTDDLCSPYISPRFDDLPFSLFSLCKIIEPNERASAKEQDFQLVHTVTAGASTANLIARFGALDQEICANLQNALAEEERHYAPAIIAEVSHISQLRMGNVNRRPSLRQYEIPVNTIAGVDEEFSIPLSDLTISIRWNRIILRSKRLNKEVIPRISSAHVYNFDGTPIYRFLGDLQFQGCRPGLKWNWGTLENLPFLPRVEYGRTIFAKAQWRLSEDQVRKLATLATEDLRAKLAELTAEISLPEYMVLVEGEEEIPLQLHSELGLAFFTDVLKKGSAIVLREDLFSLNLGSQSLVHDELGYPYQHEIVLPIRNPGSAKREALPTKPLLARQPLQTRTYRPGQNWLYIQLFCTPSSADIILNQVIKAFCEEMLSHNLISKWFFIRYDDPEPHLRVRFLATKSTGGGDLLTRFNEVLLPFYNSKLISRISVETYTRELERYGPASMEDSESLFFADSTATLNLLAYIASEQGEQQEDQRLLAGLISVDRLLTEFKVSTEQRVQIFDVLQKSFKTEFSLGDTASSRQYFANKYRGLRELITAALTSHQSYLLDGHTHAAINHILDARQATQHIYIDNIFKSISPEGVGHLVISHIHMLINRLFSQNQRICELLIYDFLFQHYRSTLHLATHPKVIPHSVSPFK
jgi:thiopeptide-type bacteriocin biosynthesis protein